MRDVRRLCYEIVSMKIPLDYSISKYSIVVLFVCAQQLGLFYMANIYTNQIAYSDSIDDDAMILDECIVCVRFDFPMKLCYRVYANCRSGYLLKPFRIA